ncbi:hypothetical protein [Streptomyces cinnamoneus]|nr:hypothetical protein [Streptomyces cinnamoneus]
MAKIISYCLEWVRARFAPRIHRRDCRACQTARANRTPAPLPVAPLTPRSPRLADLPMDGGNGPVFLWVTAHGIDIRPRRPHGGEAGR